MDMIHKREEIWIKQEIEEICSRVDNDEATHDTTLLNKANDILNFVIDIKTELKPENKTTNAPNIFCEVCKTLIDNTKYEDNKNEHKNLNRLKCDICLKQEIDDLLTSFTDQYECDYCDATFSLRGLLNQHKEIHKNGAEKRIICEICGLICEKQYLFTAHMRTHTGERPFVCDICHQRFKAVNTLKRHIKTIHVHYRQYDCVVCGAKFTKRVHLISHQRIHTGKKPFECDICRKIYDEKGEFNKHMLTHRGLKRFACDICHKSFLYNCQLTVHSKVHTNDKPFECDFCHKRFYQKGNLVYHAKTHNAERNDKQHECGVCKMRFYFKNKLNSHVAKMHRADLSFECIVCFRRYNCKEKLVNHVKRTCSKKI